jgi:regulatory protein
MPGARSYALALLKRRLRSTHELDEALKRRDVEAEERAAIIGELTEQGLINDERYAMAWIHTRDRLSPRGDFVLRQELYQRGISKDIVQEALAKRQEEQQADPALNPDQETQIKSLIERRARLYAGLPEEVRKRRLMGFLSRRGFSLDVVRRILNT